MGGWASPLPSPIGALRSAPLCWCSSLELTEGERSYPRKELLVRYPFYKASSMLASQSLLRTGAAGAFAGSIGALCGAGAGLAMIPAFRYFGVPPRQVGPSAMAVLTMGSSVGAATYLRDSVANIPTSAAIFSTSSVSAVLGARLAQRLPVSSFSLLMKPVIALSIPIVLSSTPLVREGLDNLYPPYKPEHRDHVLLRKRTSLKETVRLHHITAAECVAALGEVASAGPAAVAAAACAFSLEHKQHMLLGCVSGLASGLLGVGGGVILMMALSTTLPQKEAVATSLVALFPTGAMATVSHAAAGNLALQTVLLAGAGNAVGMYVAAGIIAPHVDEDFMRRSPALAYATSWPHLSIPPLSAPLSP